MAVNADLKRWRSVVADPPREGQVVMTSIFDMKGRRNEQLLKRVGRLWFLPSGSMYVYYTPSEWMEP